MKTINLHLGISVFQYILLREIDYILLHTLTKISFLVSSVFVCAKFFPCKIYLQRLVSLYHTIHVKT